MKGAWLAALPVSVFVLGLSSVAHAYCQTTTCDADITCTEDPEQCCIRNAAGCDTNGIPLRWPSACTSYAIQENGSPRRDISGEELSDAVDAAFRAWTEVDCQGSPSITTSNLGLVPCAEVTVSERGPNASIWMFRDHSWDHSSLDEDAGDVPAAALALTTLTYNWKTGEILDADVELNSDEANFTFGDGSVETDLLSIATHEAGHFLGLDHSEDFTATMAPSYVSGTIGLRTLSLDDERAICATYPTDRETETESCDPYGGFTAECQGSPGGCGFVQPPQARGFSNAAAWFAACSLWLLGCRRRRALKSAK